MSTTTLKTPQRHGRTSLLLDRAAELAREGKPVAIVALTNEQREVLRSGLRRRLGPAEMVLVHLFTPVGIPCGAFHTLLVDHYVWERGDKRSRDWIAIHMLPRVHLKDESWPRELLAEFQTEAPKDG